MNSFYVRQSCDSYDDNRFLSYAESQAKLMRRAPGTHVIAQGHTV